jgi:hypothetical protein
MKELGAYNGIFWDADKPEISAGTFYMYSPHDGNMYSGVGMYRDQTNKQTNKQTNPSCHTVPWSLLITEMSTRSRKKCFWGVERSR